jgi:acyl-CoA thioesterase-1
LPYFASGESLYPGVGLLILAMGISHFRVPKWLAPMRIAATWVGGAMIIMASPPVSWVFAGFLAFIFLLCLVASRQSRSTSRTTFQALISGVLLVSILVLFVNEYLHRRTPKFSSPTDDHLVVIGDSISAGIGDSASTWPAIMQNATGIQVENISKAGATVADGLAMVGQLRPTDHLVLIELGGNDLLSGESSETFARDLERLIAKTADPDRTIVMFELPLIPTAIPYGQAQRRIAAKYGVVLIPKRFFLEALSGRDATSDGLHLTKTGAIRMAAIVETIILPALKQSRSAYSSRQISLKS